MGLARAWSVALRGVEGHVVEIEADIGGGLPGVHLVGLPDAALQESRDRVRAAVVNSGRTWPNERVVLALSPATLRKAGSGFDLALACGVLAAAGTVRAARAGRAPCWWGSWRSTGGCGRCAACCRACSRRAPRASAAWWCPRTRCPRRRSSTGSRCTARRRSGRCWPGRGGAGAGPAEPAARPAGRSRCHDLADVVGQDDARRALEVAAAGGHHLLLVGPPGTGKTMLAQRIVGLLPELSSDEALALAAIRSVAGVLPAEGLTARRRSWRRTTRRRWRHWSAGGAGSPSRAPCRSRTGARSSWTRRPSSRATSSTRCAPRWRRARSGSPGRRAPCAIPARFQLVLAANPCPCAPAHDRDCVCPSLVPPPLPRAPVRAPARPRRPARPHVSGHRPVRGRRAGRGHGDGPCPGPGRACGGRGPVDGVRLAVQRRTCPVPRCGPTSRCRRRWSGRWTPGCGAAS